jgi:uncharacterized protein (TIGR03435 family)
MKPDHDKTLHRHLSLFGAPSVTQLEASRARIRERLRTQPVDLPPEGGSHEIHRRRWLPSLVGSHEIHQRQWLPPLGGRLFAWRRTLSLGVAAAIIALLVLGPAEAAGIVRDRWSRAVGRILAAFERGMADTRAPIRPSPRPAAAAAGGQAAGPTPTPAVAPAGAQTAAQDEQFEEASIRRCDPDNLPATPAGARGGGANSMQMTPGRLNALCATLATLIRVSYGYRPMLLDFNNDGRTLGMQIDMIYGIGEEDGQRVRGGPDWLRSERYTIEAVVGSGRASNAEAMSGPMLRRLLERRLQLKAHIETEQIVAFALTVARGGPRNMKKSTSADCQLLPGRPGALELYGYPGSVLEPPRQVDAVRRGEKPSCGMWGHRNGPNQVFIGGDVPMEALTDFLGNQLGGVRVIDKTGLTDRYNSVLEIAIDDNSPGFGRGRGPLPAFLQELANRDVPRAATIFTALEEQLGLHLERAQTSREFIVIERVERPAAN